MGRRNFFIKRNNERSLMDICSNQIVYSEHGVDECFEYINGDGRVPDGLAVAIVNENNVLTLFKDVKYCLHDHQYWDNFELEHDTKRVFLP